MNSSLFTAVLLLVAAGLVVGIVLTLASILMAVPSDPKEDQVREVLPGANCGACGYSGCSGYASALASGACSDCALCAPGGKEVMDKIAGILGLHASASGHQMTAVVKCRGTCAKTENRAIYEGIESCQMASQVLGGPKQCAAGCLGFGDCVRACPYHAIRLDDGVAVVDPRLCRACKICVAVCPKKLISLLPLDKKHAANLCSNREKGPIAKKQCAAACIGCSLCARKCPKKCIKVENFNALVDAETCVACGLCVKACPTQAMQMLPVSTVELLGEAKIEGRAS